MVGSSKQGFHYFETDSWPHQGCFVSSLTLMWERVTPETIDIVKELTLNTFLCLTIFNLINYVWVCQTCYLILLDNMWPSPVLWRLWEPCYFNILPFHDMISSNLCFFFFSKYFLIYSCTCEQTYYTYSSRRAVKHHSFPHSNT